MTRSPKKAGLWSVRPYRHWLTQDFTSELSTSMLIFTIPLIALPVVGSELAAGGMLSLMLIVSTVVGLPGGTLVDRINRRTALWVRSAAMVVVVSALAAALYGIESSAIAIAVGCVCLGVVTGLFKSASNILLREIVPRSLFPRAVANNQARDAALELSAAPFAGFLLAVGSFVPFLFIALSHAIAFIATLRIPASLGEVKRSGESFVRDLGFGFRYLWRNPHLILSSLIVALANFALTGVIVTLQLFLGTEGVDPAVIGLLLTATSLGMILGAILAAKTVNRMRVGVILPAALLVVTVAFASMTVLPTTVVALAAPMAVIGFVVPFSNTGLMSWLYMIVPAEFQGRVHSVGGLLSSIAVAVAPLTAGALLTLGSVQLSIALLTLSIVLAIIVALASSTIRRIGRPGDWAVDVSE